jgi:hypothetical protein
MKLSIHDYTLFWAVSVISKFSLPYPLPTRTESIRLETYYYEILSYTAQKTIKGNMNLREFANPMLGREAAASAKVFFFRGEVRVDEVRFPNVQYQPNPLQCLPTVLLLYPRG